MKIIDIHTHGIGGYDSRTTDVEHILKTAGIHGSYGVSQIIPTIYPATIKVMRENMEVVRKAMERQKDISDPPSPATPRPSFIAGVHLEGPFLNISKCGSLNAMTFLDPSEYHLKELVEGFEDMVKIITLAPELNGAVALIRKISDTGIIASMGHSDATYAEAEDGFNAGAKGVTHIFNAMRAFHHREPGLAGFGLMNQDIYIEVIADPHHLHPAMFEIIFKVKNNDKIIIISDSVKETKTYSPHAAGLTAREAIAGKTQGVTDARGRLLGGSMTVTEAVKNLVEYGFDEAVAMKCITVNPVMYLNHSS